jgi:alkylation response protein AidB-like acyl-CoA dehydrogenase
VDFGLSEAQEMLRRTARDYLSSRPVGSGSPGDWHTAAGLGWTGLLVPEAHGGAGLTFTDMAALLDEWGAWLGEGPLVESSVVAALSLSRSGSESARARLLPGIADGSAPVTLALSGRDGAPALAATPHRSRWRLDGEAWFADYADAAAAAIVPARDTSTGRILVFAAGLTSGDRPELVRLKTASGTPSFAIKFSGENAGRDALLGDAESGDDVLRYILRAGAAARSVQMAGAARRVLEVTVSYVSGRKQFGRSVGSFQAVQHMCAEMATMLQGGRHAAYRAVWALGEGRPAVREAALAKLSMNDALARICSMAHQCHGAIGFTADYGLHRYTRAAIAWRAEFGDSASQAETLASAMDL